MFDRRRFLQVSTLAASASVAGCTTKSARQTAASRPAHLGAGAPKRIIHMVADGMSLGTLSCADQLSHLERGRGLTWFDLYSRPESHSGLMDMRSLDSLVTDSAAASSSWGSGTRVRNGTLNVTSGGNRLTPLMELFGQAGWKRGLVTTTEITHATPAGFTVSVGSRGESEEIAVRYLDTRLDLLLGGAKDHFDPAKRKDKRNLWAEFEWDGYFVARTLAELERAPRDRRWLGTFSSSHLPFTLDHRGDTNLQKTVPTLPVMVECALAKLESADRFLLQIEGGRVDHACHNNDAASALRDQITFDEALDRVLAFIERHPETLLVVTTDHGNANPGLNGMGASYRDSPKHFRKLAGIRASFPEILKALKAAKSEKDSSTVLADLTGYQVPAKKLTEFLPFVGGKGHSLFDQMSSDVAGLGQLLANHTGIGFTGTTHTSDYVPIVACGPGSESFRGLIRNTDVFSRYTELAQIDFRNPQEPLLAAAPTHEHATVEDCSAYARAYA